MMNRIISLLNLDENRLSALACVSSLNLPDCYVAAGFIRNLVWDALHNKSQPTPLNDIDVIYFDPKEVDTMQSLAYEAKLKAMQPNVNWQVRNQAFMHLRNNDQAYSCSLDAMSYWPEKETAVGVRQLANGEIECVSPFGFDSLFRLNITYNPKRLKSVFEQRITTKAWCTTWPKLNVKR